MRYHKTEQRTPLLYGYTFLSVKYKKKNIELLLVISDLLIWKLFHIPTITIPLIGCIRINVLYTFWYFSQMYF